MADQGKGAVLTLLREAGNGWVSGEALSRLLGVSRTAIWKQVKTLRAAGYLLEAKPRLGYRLVGLPDAVTPAEILAGLSTRALGRHIEYRESVGSTNEAAKQLARAGAPEGLLVIADEQTAGKGRLGRTWSTPRGSALAMSLVLRPELPPYHATRITLVAAVAVAEAVRAVTGITAGIKWPNDVQINERKFCGILTEMEAQWDQVAFVVCGIGLNVNLTKEQMAPEVRERATSLLLESGICYERSRLAQAILIHFEQAYAELVAGRFEQVLQRWRSHAVTLGQEVQIRSITGELLIEGRAVEVDEDGALLVRLADGSCHKVMAGEVSVRQR